MHPLALHLDSLKLTMSDRGGSRDSLSGRLDVVEEVVASFPSLSSQLHEFTKELIKAVDEKVHKINELGISSEGKTVCYQLLVVINKYSYDYMQAISDFIWNAQQNERQQLAFKEAAKKEDPNFGPMNEYIRHVKRYLGRAGEKYEIFCESCKGAVAWLEEMSEKIQENADKEGTKITASQVASGLVAGGAVAVGTGAGIGIGLSLAAVGMAVSTVVAAPAVRLGTGTVAAVGTHLVAKHYNEKKMAFRSLTGHIMKLKQQAAELNHVLNKINTSMNTFDELTQDIEYYTAPHQRGLVLNSMKLLFVRLEEFHSLSSECCETLKRKSEALKQLMIS